MDKDKAKSVSAHKAQMGHSEFGAWPHCLKWTHHLWPPLQGMAASISLSLGKILLLLLRFGIRPDKIRNTAHLFNLICVFVQEGWARSPIKNLGSLLNSPTGLKRWSSPKEGLSPFERVPRSCCSVKEVIVLAGREGSPWCAARPKSCPCSTCSLIIRLLNIIILVIIIIVMGMEISCGSCTHFRIRGCIVWRSVSPEGISGQRGAITRGFQRHLTKCASPPLSRTLQVYRGPLRRLYGSNVGE